MIDECCKKCSDNGCCVIQEKMYNGKPWAITNLKDILEISTSERVKVKAKAILEWLQENKQGEADGI